jgi:hypothetical protein
LHERETKKKETIDRKRATSQGSFWFFSNYGEGMLEKKNMNIFTHDITLPFFKSNK